MTIYTIEEVVDNGSSVVDEFPDLDDAVTDALARAGRTGYMHIVSDDSPSTARRACYPDGGVSYIP